MSLSPFTRLELADLAERITEADPDGAAVIRSALTEDIDQDAEDAEEDHLLTAPGAVWADSYARSIAGGLSADLAARHADVTEAHARTLRTDAAEGVKP